MFVGPLLGVGSHHLIKHCLEHLWFGWEVPETIISGQTSDISPIADLEWYEWIKWKDGQASYPEDKLSLGRYLGPSLDVGPAMAIKVLKENGEVIRLSSYRGLTPDELDNPLEQAARTAFDTKIQEKLGAEMTSKDLSEKGLDAEIPVYESYEDDDDGEHRQAPDEEEPTSELADNYIGAEVLLPMGDKMVSGSVRRRKRDREGSVFGKANINPILDTRV